MCMGRERTIIGRAPGYQNTSRFIRIILTHRPTFVNLCKLYIAQLKLVGFATQILVSYVV
jgi:hypothetical protein